MHWSRIAAACLGLLAALLALSACGSQGYAPPLTNAVHVTLPGNGAAHPGGSATLTPTYGGHYAVYLQGKQVPYHNPATPVELRKGSCTGPVIGALTDNTPAMPQLPIMQPASDNGADVAIAPAADVYVVVLAQAGNPNAPAFACGNPLSERRQYFELWPAGADETVGIGTVLSESLVSTKVDISLDTPATTAAPVAWAIRSGSCTGATVANGTLTGGTTSASGFIFQQLASDKWWLTLAPTGQQGSCVKVSGS
jgi:hypothetical protein